MTENIKIEAASVKDLSEVDIESIKNDINKQINNYSCHADKYDYLVAIS